MSWFIRFMVSPVGRWARTLAGIALIGAGLLVVGGVVGVAVAAVGLVPLLAGALDACLFAPACGYSLSGPRTRAQL